MTASSQSSLVVSLYAPTISAELSSLTVLMSSSRALHDERLRTQQVPTVYNWEMRMSRTIGSHTFHLFVQPGNIEQNFTHWLKENNSGTVCYNIGHIDK